jgi:uncharacterized damage-inducible protein DinB
MDIPLSIERLLAHDRWANGETLSSLEAMTEPPAAARALLGHILGAEATWLSRMMEGRELADGEVWETADLPWLRAAWRDRLPSRWAALLADPALRDPARRFSYVNFLGNTMDARVGDAVTQLMLHSAYHRGQVATAVRAAGGVPAVVDFMHAVRTGALGTA